MNITYQKTPNGKYRATANIDTGYGLLLRAWGKTKAEAKKNLLAKT